MKNFLKYSAVFLLCSLIIFNSSGLIHRNPPPDNMSAQVNEKKWVDSVFKALSPEQRIAQLFMIPAYSNKSLEANKQVTELIKKYNIGGIIFFQGGPLKQASYANYWQSLAKTPLFVAIDGEWGLGMRLKDSTVSFPKQMTLGAIKNEELIYEMGKEIGWQCKRLGININFAPVADINSNPKNPVINYRSFGENKYNVARKAIAYMKGMQQQGVIANAKHFPGHGDTDKDSHKTLPGILHTASYIDSVDLYPFRQMMVNKLASVMVGHLFVPSLDSTPNLPASLSYKIITGLLKNKMQFRGLIFTDALGMKGVSDDDNSVSVDLAALQAGNDVLLMSENVELSIAAIKENIAAGKIKQHQIDSSCIKILRFKYRYGLAGCKPVSLVNLYTDLNNSNSEKLNQKLHNASITIIKNNNNFLPLFNLNSQKIASVSFNSPSDYQFCNVLEHYAKVRHFIYQSNISENDFKDLPEKLSPYNPIIITVNQTSNSATDNYGFTANIIELINRIGIEKTVVLNLLCNPYSLEKLADTSILDAIVVGYQSNDYSQRATAEAIFGGIAVNGRLPVTASAYFKEGVGFETKKCRLSYGYPSWEKMNNNQLQKIDSVVMKGINDTVFPGCQVLIARNGNIVYHKSFGYHTYENKYPVKNTDLYDIASVTKIAATSISLMKLYEEGKINIDSSLVRYLPEVDKTNKATVIIKDILTHQAGFKAWIPFYKKMISGKGIDTSLYRKEPCEEFPVRLAEGIYIGRHYQDTIFKTIIGTDFRNRHDYQYSDLGFYLLKIIIEKQVNEGIDNFVKTRFYDKLGLSTICYTPRKYFDLSRIIPSEIDTNFRLQLLQGDVNDQGAAMLGGVAGHAGLFSNSADLAVLLQMLLQNGNYGREQYFKPSTVKLFTSYQFTNNRRGLGFDKPVREKNQNGPTCDEASEESYGHSGFTGTFVWVDPKYDLVYVFLSNRTYPYSSNNKLLASGIRTIIQKIIYQSLEK